MIVFFMIVFFGFLVALIDVAFVSAVFSPKASEDATFFLGWMAVVFTFLFWMFGIAR